MKSLLNQITAEYVKPKKKTANEDTIYNILKKNLSRDNKSLLLQLIDEKDYKIEQLSCRYFKSGFCEGIRFAIEIFK